MISVAKKRDTVLLQSTEPTSRLNGAITAFLDEKLSTRTTVHGVLMDIFGVGVLIQGSSGIGKSETGLELIKRGHRLVADDRVDVYQKDEFTVVGEPAEILRHLIELRGVGIIDVMSLFGAGAVMDSSQVDLSVYLEKFEKAAIRRSEKKLQEVRPQAQGINCIRHIYLRFLHSCSVTFLY